MSNMRILPMAKSHSKRRLCAASTLTALIAKHEEAVKTDEILWDTVAEIHDRPDMKGRPFPKVQISRLYCGKDDNNNAIWEPQYGYDEDAINKKIDQHLNSQLAMLPGDKLQTHREKVSADFEQQRARMLGEFRTQKAERQRIEDESGYADAIGAAKLSTAAVRRIEADILSFVPTSLSDAALKAQFVAAVYNNEQDGYIDEPEQLVAALAAIGRALA